ncbi:MAG TPA: hypothetical protein PLC65_07500, partial [Bacteroidia bacterium]|nr:hypothetical protein [Bacteroidia bacterium]
GLNKVYWNMRETPPKVAAGSTKMDGAGFTAPMVLPGQYKLKVKVKDKEYEGKVNCIHDAANKDLSEADRKLVYEKATQLKTLYSNINNTIDTINLYQNQLKKDTVAFKKNKNAMAFHADLQKVKSDLMATTKKSIFADEERLREKVSKLYGSFCGMESKPNATQLESIDDLSNEFSKKKKEMEAALMKHLPKNPEIKNNKDIR